MKIMKDREDKISGDLTTAEETRKQAADYLKEQKELLNQAKNDAVQFMENARKQADFQRDELLTLAKQEAESLKENAKLEIEKEKEQALRAVKNEVATLSLLIAGKVIEKELTAADQAKLIEKYLKEAGEKR
jgi:F-type H+-transporting ATPase subunit b